jgi:hypothetical protein
MTLIVSGPLDFAIVEAKDSQPAAGTTAAFDRCVAQLGNPTQINLPSSSVANFDTSRLTYLAGTPDRMISSSTFVRLNPPTPLSTRLTVDNLFFWQSQVGGKIYQLGKDLFKAFDKQSQQLAVEVDKGKLSVDEYYAQAQSSLSKAVTAGTNLLGKKPADAVKVAIASKLAISKKKTDSQTSVIKSVTQPSKPAAQATGEQGFSFNMGQQRSMFIPGNNNPKKISGEGASFVLMWIKALRASQRVGILFLDRIRIQPVGTVVGEPLYKLTLTPGEEVQLRQSSETRKRKALTEIENREAEQSLTLSSTLSTDLTSTISDTRSFQSQMNLGGGLSGTIPETPIGLSLNAGTSADSAHTNSISQTASFHNEVVSTSMAKLRAEHKTTLEVTTEETTGYTTTRTVRNTNQQRSQMHTFYKQYRKDRLTLERHDAQLCVRVEVNDPAKETRAAFLSAFHRLDPNNKANWDLPEYGDMPYNKDFTLAEPADQEPWHLLGGTHERWSTLQIPNLKAFLGAPANFELIDSPKLVMKSVTIFTENSDIAGAEGTHNYTDAHTLGSSSAPNVDLQIAFNATGGSVKWNPRPEPMTDNLLLGLDVNFAFNMEGRPGVAPFIELGSVITSVTFNVSATFGPSDALNQERFDKLLRRKREALDGFDPGSVYALGAAARADYPGEVLDQAVRQTFAGLSLEQMSTIGRIFDLEKVVIESVPFWGSKHASSIHYELKWLLERLPKRVVSNEVLTPQLTGSLATVYLPIRHGMEHEAIGLLSEFGRKAREDLIKDFNNMRDRRFGLARSLTVSTATTISAPTLPTATPAGATSWQTNWEGAMKKFEVLAEWSELTPTDGVHVETQLSATTVTDEHATNHLERSG